MEARKPLSASTTTSSKATTLTFRRSPRDVAAQKTRFDTYDTKPKAYTARVGVVESQARAFPLPRCRRESSANIRDQNIDATSRR